MGKKNIRQEQFERIIGPIAFYPASVMFDSGNVQQLLEKVGVRQLISDVIDELIDLAKAHGCSFPSDFNQKTMEKMTTTQTPNTMYQDFQARRPMEIETYLGSPIKLATESNVKLPRIETLYAMLHHINATNLSKPRDSPPPALAQPPPRVSSVPPPRNGPMRPPPGRSSSAMMMPPPRRGPPMPGMSRPPSAQPPAGGPRMPREPSLEGLEEFSHLVVYDDAGDQGMPANDANGYPDVPPGAGPSGLALRERELAIRQRELQLREQEMHMRRGPRRPPPSKAAAFDEEDEDDYFDPMDTSLVPQIDPDNVDMLSITSKRTKKIPSASQIRKNPELLSSTGGGGGGGGGRTGTFSRYFGGNRKRASDRIMQEIPGLHDSLLDNPMMAYSSNRYGSVDRNQMAAGSRTNSMTTSRMGDYPPHPYPQSRRNSHSPAAPFGGPPGPRMGRPATAQDQNFGPPHGPPNGGHPSPPGHMRAPVPRHPPGHGNAVGPQQVEQQIGVSKPYPAKGTPKHRSLTGSASASAESGDSGASANLDSETSAHSSQISLGAQPAAAPVH